MVFRLFSLVLCKDSIHNVYYLIFNVIYQGLHLFMIKTKYLDLWAIEECSHFIHGYHIHIDKSEYFYNLMISMSPFCQTMWACSLLTINAVLVFIAVKAVVGPTSPKKCLWYKRLHPLHISCSLSLHKQNPFNNRLQIIIMFIYSFLMCYSHVYVCVHCICMYM